MRIVCIPGSLRAQSSNKALLRAAAALAPADLELVLCEDAGALPLFNPDLDVEGAEAPAAVRAFRARLAAAHGFVVSSPRAPNGLADRA